MAWIAVTVPCKENSIMQHGGHTPANRLTEACMLWDGMVNIIDTCQNKVSADQYHMTITQAQV